MSFISALEINKKYSTRGGHGRGRASVDHDICLATDKSVAKTGQIVYSLRFSISQRLIKEARFISGDKIDVLFDFESTPKRALIVRSLGGGWSLYCNGKNKNSRFNFKITHRPELPSFTESTPTTAIVTSEGILFDLPPTAIFGRNARI
jgi:hypothetical protein